MTARPRFASVLVLLCVACGDASQSAPSSTSTTTATGTAIVASASASAKSGPIGVAACDRYLSRARGCLGKAPEAERSARAKLIDDIEGQWLSRAKTAPSDAPPPALVSACELADAELASAPACR
ncbi:MAG: hypothetical protein U0271_42510 [Polyangiaceae bacterium]